MAPIPEAMPAATQILESDGVRLRVRARTEPNPAEICAVGPSRPPEPPEPMVRTEATSLTAMTRGRTPFGLVWTVLMAASVPCPSASGARPKTSSPAASPPTPTTRGTAHGREKSLAGRKPPSPAVEAGV